MPTALAEPPAPPPPREPKRRKRGRRPHEESTCRNRLRGWLKNVARRSSIWGDVDLQAFCRVTGYSREHAQRELSYLRRKEDNGLAFETKMRRKKQTGRKVWGVIVAERKKLLFDERSLFYSRDGKRLHNRTHLGHGGRKIAPTTETPLALHTDGRNRQQQHQRRLCDIAKTDTDCRAIQQKYLNGDKRHLADARRRLRNKAFSLLPQLEANHWDNCKVRWNRRTAFCYVFKALRNGHETDRILRCYEKALHICHGLAVDKAASSGQITFFEISSTVSKAREMLSSDGLSRRQRIHQWYQDNKKSPPTMPENIHPEEAPELDQRGIDPEELAEVRRMIEASFPP